METTRRASVLGAICLLAALFAAGGLSRYWLRQQSTPVLTIPPAPAAIPPPANAPSTPPANAPGPGDLPSATVPVSPVPTRLPVTVHVAGCVKVPGLYSFAPGARAYDAVKRAGGAKPNADLDAINLAAKLEDGAQVYVPAKPVEEKLLAVAPTRAPAPPGRVPLTPRAAPPAASTAKPMPGDEKGSGAPEKITSPSQGRVNVNRASAEELQKLPHVGPATAKKILDYRQANGPFRSVEELLEIRGIGPKYLAELRPLVDL